MPGIFGPTGSEVYRQLQRDRALQAAQTGQQFGQLAAQDPSALFGRVGGMLGGAVGERFAPSTSPALERAERMDLVRQRLLTSGVDSSNDVAYATALGTALAEEGFVEEAQQVHQQAREAQRDDEEVANLQSMIRRRREQSEIERERIASTERIAAMKTERGPVLKPRRAATGSDRTQATPVIKDTLGAELFDEVENQPDLIAWVAQRARDLAHETPGLDMQDAQEQAAGEAQQFVIRRGRFDIPGRADFTFNAPGGAGEETGSAVAPQAAAPVEDARSRADRILGL